MPGRATTPSRALSVRRNAGAGGSSRRAREDLRAHGWRPGAGPSAVLVGRGLGFVARHAAVELADAGLLVECDRGRAQPLQLAHLTVDPDNLSEAAALVEKR